MREHVVRLKVSQPNRKLHRDDEILQVLDHALRESARFEQVVFVFQLLHHEDGIECFEDVLCVDRIVDRAHLSEMSTYVELEGFAGRNELQNRVSRRKAVDRRLRGVAIAAKIGGYCWRASAAKDLATDLPAST